MGADEPAEKKITKKALLDILMLWDKEELLAIKREQLNMKLLTSKIYQGKNKYETIAHRMAFLGYPFSPEEDGEILRLRDYCGRTVALFMACAGYRFDPEKHRDILLITDDSGQTVAHQMAGRGYCFDPEKHREFLLLTDNSGWTVAHYMIKYNKKCYFDVEKHKDYLLLTNNEGISVAHLQAKSGFVFDPGKHRDICELTDRKGKNVIDYFLKSNQPEIKWGKFDDTFMSMSSEGLREYIERAKKRKMKDVRERLEKLCRIKKAKQEINEKLNALDLKL